MTKAYHASIEFPTIGGDPLDYSHNTFTWDAPDAITDTLAADAVKDALSDFYNVTPAGGTFPVSHFMGQQLSRAADAVLIRVYNITGHLDGSPHGSPVALRTLTLGAAATPGPSLPEGCAVGLSFHAEYASDAEFGPTAAIPTEARAQAEGAPATHPGKTRPRARDRGRVYIGPLSSAAFGVDATTQRVSVGLACIGNLQGAAARLRDTGYPGTGEEITWVVWSRRNASIKTVVGGWVDDRIDYQRTREDQGLSRFSW